MTEAGGVDNGTVGDPDASGELDVSDADAGEAHFQVPAAAALVGTYGDFTFNATTGAWTYTLDNDRAATEALTAGEQVTDTLTVMSYDGTASETITVDITGANDAPTQTGIPPGSFGDEGSGLVVSHVFVDDPDSDDDPSTLTYEITNTTLPYFRPEPIDVTAVTVLNNGDGTFAVDANDPVFDQLYEEEALLVLFKFTATDRHGASGSFTDSIFVLGVNDAPTAVSDSVVAAFNQPILVDEAFLLANDSDPDTGASLDIVSMQIVAGLGTVVDNGNDTWTYNPAANEQHVALQYTVEDEYQAQSTASVHIDYLVY